MKGRWTLPKDLWDSSHLIAFVTSGGTLRTRCGLMRTVDPRTTTTTDEPPGTGKTCESCLRDG